MLLFVAVWLVALNYADSVFVAVSVTPVELLQLDYCYCCCHVHTAADAAVVAVADWFEISTFHSSSHYLSGTWLVLLYKYKLKIYLI